MEKVNAFVNDIVEERSKLREKIDEQCELIADLNQIISYLLVDKSKLLDEKKDLLQELDEAEGQVRFYVSQTKFWRDHAKYLEGKYENHEQIRSAESV